MTIILATMAKFIVAAGFLSLGALAIGGPALASEPTAASTVTYPVRYGDLDVATAKSAKSLYLRVRYAAETVCESASTWDKKEGEACVNKAVNDVVSRVNAPLPTKYSQLRSKGDKAGLVQLANAE